MQRHLLPACFTMFTLALLWAISSAPAQDDVTLPAASFTDAPVEQVLTFIEEKSGVKVPLGQLQGNVTVSWDADTPVGEALTRVVQQVQGSDAPTEHGFAADPGKAAAILNHEVQAIDVQDAELATALRVLAEKSGVEIFLPQDYPDKISLSAEAGSRLRDVLRQVLQQTGLRYFVDKDGRLVIADQATYQLMQHGEVKQEHLQKPTPADPLDRGITAPLRLLNVALGEAVGQLSEVCEFTVTACPAARDIPLRMSLGEGTPVRTVLDHFARMSKGHWSLRGENTIEVCIAAEAEQTTARPATPDPAATLHLADERLQLIGKELFFRGRPVKLVGLSYEPGLCDTRLDMARWLDLLVRHNLNYTRVFLASPWRGTLLPFAAQAGKYNLNEFDDAFFRRLATFVALADERDIVVQLCLFEATHQDPEAPASAQARSPFAPEHNMQQLARGYTATAPWFTAEGPAFEVLTALARKTVATVGDAPNVLYEVCSEAPAETETWQNELARQLRQTLADNPAPLVLTLGPQADLTALDAGPVDLYMFPAASPGPYPAQYAKPCVVTTYGHSVSGDIRPFVDAACRTPGGHFLHRLHLLPGYRYWSEGPAPDVLPAPPTAQQPPEADRFARRLSHLAGLAAHFATNPVYDARASIPRRPGEGKGILPFYGELKSGQQILQVADYSTLGAVDLDTLTARQAARAVQYLRSKDRFALLEGSGEDAVGRARKVLDELWLTGRRDAIANVWAVLLGEADYAVDDQTALLYAGDRQRVAAMALLRTFQQNLRDVRTPWDEQPFAHIQSMLIFAPSTQAAPGWGPWEMTNAWQPVQNRPLRLLPAGLDIVGLRLPPELAGDTVQTQRLAAALRGSYPRLYPEDGPPFFPMGEPPLAMLIGTSQATTGVDTATLIAAQDLYFEQARNDFFVGLLWWRHDAMPEDGHLQILEKHQAQGRRLLGKQ